MRKITISDSGVELLSGTNEQNLKVLENFFDVRMSGRGEEVFIEGPEEKAVLIEKILREISKLIESGHKIRTEDIRLACALLAEDNNYNLRNFIVDSSVKVSAQTSVRPRSLNQMRYMESIRLYDIVFGIGPAGTGKTYLAVAMAVAALHERFKKRIILTRPAVEAGEKLGFLPGDLYQKVDPYLRPLYDALYDMLDPNAVGKLMTRGIIEIAPLAFMRGRTLNDSFVILDEAQNTTSEQMKMLLTRIGFNSKAVITGDITQIDLPTGKISGLKEAIKVIAPIEGIRFVFFNEKDVVRHPLVQSIILAYEKHTLEMEKARLQIRNHGEDRGDEKP
jgi:phosphate starvation-inducible PhoH-like protein